MRGKSGSAQLFQVPSIPVSRVRGNPGAQTGNFLSSGNSDVGTGQSVRPLVGSVQEPLSDHPCIRRPKRNPFFTALRCRECGREYPKEAIHVCEWDFGPLEAAYDYDAIGAVLTREAILSRPRSMWRYRELLPIDGPAPAVGHQTGCTPLVRADRLAARLGLNAGDLWIKNDTVNFPTLSFKDRVVSVALSRAKELGFDTVACASTGNLANSVAANAAAAGLKSYVLIPADLEPSKVLGSLVFGTNVIGIHGAYDQVNRLCSEIAGKYGWGFVNVNLRPYYAEGSKTMGFEICEQLGWKASTRHTVVCRWRAARCSRKSTRPTSEFYHLAASSRTRTFPSTARRPPAAARLPRP